jgi:hypothetical protein
MEYNLTFYNDMGHLLCEPYNTTPKHILDFADSKFNLYGYLATDIATGSARYYILKPGYSDKWTYYCGNDVVNITYHLNVFDSKRMKVVDPNAPRRYALTQPYYAY